MTPGTPQDGQSGSRWGHWTKERYVALCADDKCPWKYVTDSYITVSGEADEHVAEVGHDVTIHSEKRLTVEAYVFPA